MAIPAPAWYVHARPCPECHDVHMRCADHAIDGEACRNQVVKGSWKCHKHGGKALRDLAPVDDAEVDDLVKTYASVGPLLEAAQVRTSGMDFSESIQDGLNRANAMVVVLRMLIGTLAAKAQATVVWNDDGQKPYLVVDVKKEGFVGPDDKGNLNAHPWLVLYRDWVALQVQFAKAAADLGIAERNVRVAEAQTAIMAETMMALLTDFGIDVHAPQNMTIIERRLLAMDNTVIELGTPALTGAASSS